MHTTKVQCPAFITDPIKRAVPERSQTFIDTISQLNAPEEDVHFAMERLADIFAAEQLYESAGLCHDYLSRTNEAILKYTKTNQHLLVGLVMLREEQYQQAAEIFVHHGHHTHAAIAYERANNFSEAYAAWLHESRRYQHEGQLLQQYQAQLAAAMSAHQTTYHQEAPQLYEATIYALTQWAAEQEHQMNYQAARYAYRAIIYAARRFSDRSRLLLGHLNTIRLLRLSHQRFNTLRQYDDCITDLQNVGAHFEQAEILGEAVAFARQHQFEFDTYFEYQAGLGWERVAATLEEQEGQHSLLEHVLTRAAQSYEYAGAFMKAQSLYQRLLTLPELSAVAKDNVERRQLFLSNEFEDPRHLKQTTKRPAFLNEQRQAHGLQTELLNHTNGYDFETLTKSFVGAHGTIWDIDRRLAFMVSLRAQSAPLQADEQCRLLQLFTNFQGGPLRRHILRILAKPDIKYRDLLLDVASSPAQVDGLDFAHEMIEVFILWLEHPNTDIQSVAKMAFQKLQRSDALSALRHLYEVTDRVEIQQLILQTAAQIGSAPAAQFLLDVYSEGLPETSENAIQLLEQHAGERMLAPLRKYIDRHFRHDHRQRVEGILQKLRHKRRG